MDKLQADKLTEIREAYIERLAIAIERNPHFRVDAVTVQVDVSYLLRLVETQAKALEWYADEDNYDPTYLDKIGIIPIDDDRGQRAREALNSQRNKIKNAMELV